MRCVVIGSGGQLGRCLVGRLEAGRNLHGDFECFVHREGAGTGEVPRQVLPLHQLHRQKRRNPRVRIRVRIRVRVHITIPVCVAVGICV